MFRKLQSVLSPMSAMKIDPVSESNLSQKLHLITQHIINSGKQFDAWMQLQNNNRLHFCLFEVYLRGCKSEVSEDDLASILQFYTLLIINSKDELLLCKIVSDDFVIELCQLKQLPQSLAADLEAYRINLIKAYMGTITPQTVKYMVLHDKFKVFYICVELYHSKIGTSTLQATTIANAILNAIKKVDDIPFLWESIWMPQGLQLLLTHCLAFIKQLLTGVSSTKKIPIQQKINKQIRKESEKQKQSLQFKQEGISSKHQKQSLEINNKNVDSPLVGQIIQQQQKFDQKQSQIILQAGSKQIANSSQALNQQVKHQDQQDSANKIKIQSVQQQQKKQQINAQLSRKQQQFKKDKIEVLQQIVLFVIQLQSSISNVQIKSQIIQYCYMDLEEILIIINNYCEFESKVFSFSVLFALFKAYGFEQEAVESILDLWITEILDYIANRNTTKEVQLNVKQKQKSELSELLCRAIFILCKIVSSKYSLLSERWIDQTASIDKIKSIQGMRTEIMAMLVLRLSACLDQLEESQPSLLLHFIKNILLTAFNLKIAIHFSISNCSSQTTEINSNSKQKELQYKLDQTILQLFLAYTDQFKKLMYHNQLWNSIIKWYEQAATQVTNSLLSIGNTFERITEDKPYIIMLTYEYIKNYRYMIVQSTTLDPKAIKQQKFYHSTFSSPGMAYAPGLVVSDILNVVCPCLMHHNYQQIPVVVIEDKECFILGIKLNQEQYKILANIKFKDIEGLVYGSTQGTENKSNSEVPKFVKINLKGMQQILLEFSNPKVVGNAFKDYLIRSRDMTRQRQLTFLNAWIKDYQTDAEKSLEMVKQLLKKQDYIVL